jgi:hypothetical protein
MLLEQLTMRLFPLHEGEDSKPMSHFLASVGSEFTFQNCHDSDMVGITLSNEGNVQDKTIGISFRGLYNPRCNMGSYRESSPIQC